MTDELRLPAEAWRVEPNTSWRWCWLAIQDLSQGGMGVGCSKSLSFQTNVSCAKVRVNEAIATLPWATAPDRGICFAAYECGKCVKFNCTRCEYREIRDINTTSKISWCTSTPLKLGSLTEYLVIAYATIRVLGLFQFLSLNFKSIFTLWPFQNLNLWIGIVILLLICILVYT